MRVYQLDIKVLTPLIVARPSSGNIARHDTGYILGQTIRGALLFRAYIEGRKKWVEDETKKPSLVFHTAYPLVEEKPAVPAHPFIYQCKVCGVVVDILPSLAKAGFEPTNSVLPDACPNGHMLGMKSLGGSLVVKKDVGWEKVKTEFVRVENVGMNRKFRTSEVGMIYNYVCVAPGQKFRSLIVSVGEDGLNKLLDGLGQPFTLQLGRGATRGLSHAEATIRELRNDELEKEIVRKTRGSAPHLLLLAKAPVLSLSWDKGSVKISLHHEIPRLRYRYGWITKTIVFSGFSLASGLPKAMLTCASQGSLYAYYLTAEIDEMLSNTLTRAAFIGLQPHNHIGLNLLEVVEPA
ncbi:MAG: hypothetical protein QXI50_05025 [Candidatus Caldarchaeum sp.]